VHNSKLKTQNSRLTASDCQYRQHHAMMPPVAV
jgi:hypothetical protein